MPSIGERISQTSKALFGRGVQYEYWPPSLESIWLRQTFGISPPFNPKQAQQAYSNNPSVHSDINGIANEVVSTTFRLVRRTDSGEIEDVEHQAIEPLRQPQPTAVRKSLLTTYQLEYLLAQYLMHKGESF